MIEKSGGRQLYNASNSYVSHAIAPIGVLIVMEILVSPHQSWIDIWWAVPI